MSTANRKLIILSFACIYIVWGSTYMFNKVILEELPPFLLSGIRFVIASAMIFIWLFFTKKLSTPILRKQWFNAAFIGILFITIGNGFVIYGLQFVDSGVTALIIALEPLILLIMMWAMRGKKVPGSSWVGVALGIIGMYLLISQKDIVQSDQQWIGILFIIIALIAWAYGAIRSTEAALPEKPIFNTAIQMGSGGLVLCIASILMGDSWTGLTTLSSKAIGSLSFLILLGSIATFTAYNFLLRHVSPEKVATSTYVNPVIALFLGVTVLKEAITLQSMLAALLMLTGVSFITTTGIPNFRKRRRLGRA